MKKCTKCKIEKNLDEFAWRMKKLNKKASECKQCHKKIRKQYYINNKEKENNRVKQRRKKIKHWFKEYKLGLKCNRCNQGNPACLVFHHKDKKEKEISVGVAVAYAWSISRIKKEIEKCEVLCANCHMIEHFGNLFEDAGIAQLVER